MRPREGKELRVYCTASQRKSLVFELTGPGSEPIPSEGGPEKIFIWLWLAPLWLLTPYMPGTMWLSRPTLRSALLLSVMLPPSAACLSLRVSKMGWKVIQAP